MLASVQTFVLFFKLGLMIDTTKLQFDTSLNDLDLHSRSQLYENSKGLLSSSLLVSWFAESQARFILCDQCVRK